MRLQTSFESLFWDIFVSDSRFEHYLSFLFELWACRFQLTMVYFSGERSFAVFANE